MKSEKCALDQVGSGSVSLYRQIQLNQFQQFGTVLIACEDANNKGGACHYIINVSGKEYYEGPWID